MRYANNSVVYLPVETAVRELESRLLIATSKYSQGSLVVIGPSNVLRRVSQRFPGVYLHKRHTRGDLGLIQQLVRNGNTVCALDEEALQFGGELADWSAEASRPEVLGIISRVFCNTEDQYKAMKLNSGKLAERIINSGNPRFDLLKAPFLETTRRKLHRKLKEPFVLINTTFSTGNFSSSYGITLQEHRERLNTVARLDDTEVAKQFEYLDNMYQRESELFRQYKLAVTALSSIYPHLNFVLRPHPTEDIRAWKRHTRKLTNVLVTRKEAVIHFIRRAIVVVHPGCTTALEAQIAGVPTIYFDPLNDSSNEVPDHYSCHVRNIDELVAEIDQCLTNHVSREDIAPEANTFEAGDAIARELNSLASRTNTNVARPRLLFWLTVFSILYEIGPVTRAALGSLLRPNLRRTFVTASLSKFPWQNPRRVRHQLEKLDSISSGNSSNSGNKRTRPRLYLAGPRTFVVANRLK